MFQPNKHMKHNLTETSNILVIKKLSMRAKTLRTIVYVPYLSVVSNLPTIS